MQALETAEALMIARALDPSQTSVLLQILATDPIEDSELVQVRLRGLSLHLLHLLRRNRLLGELTRTRCHALIELQMELERPLAGAMPSRKLKRRVWDTLVEMIEIASQGSSRERLATIRQRVVQLGIQGLTEKCLGMSLRTLQDFRIDQRTEFVRAYVSQQNPSYAKLVTPSMMGRDIVPVVTQNLKDLNHYIKIRQPKRRRRKAEPQPEESVRPETENLPIVWSMQDLPESRDN